MRVIFFSNFIMATNDYGQYAKIEGKILTELLRAIDYRKRTSNKRDATLACEILESWDYEMLQWGDVKSANS